MKIEEMIKANRADCSGCEACANICPRNAIEVIRDAEGFAYPKINPDLCIKCGRCDSICPSLNYAQNLPDALPKVFTAINPDEKIRRHSSSGGVFSALSEIILKDGGVVFGAGFDKNFHVVHTCAKNLDELENLRGSKYVQSQIGDVYRQVKNALKSQKVLFSGMPCQCVGLKRFLGKDYDNLLTVDIICHGVPSPALWEYYIDSMNDSHEITHVNFRSKRKSWRNFFMEVNFKDCGYYAKPIATDIFGKLFLHNLILRPSCHSCKFKFPNGQSDLTLGDAWGVQDFAPEFFDNRGTSLVIVHTAKGNSFFEKTTLSKQEVKMVVALRKNTAFLASAFASKWRENFFEDLAKTLDKLSVMQRYFYQDDTEIRKEISRNNVSAYRKNYQAIARHIRKNFNKNILVISEPREDFEQQFPNCGVYFLQTIDSEQLVCTENFSSLKFKLKAESVELKRLAKRFNITEIYISEPLNCNSTVVTDWLKNCKLPIQNFSCDSD